MDECQRCGACCRAEPGYGGGAYVRLAPDDEERLQLPEARNLLVTCGNRRAMRLVQTGRNQVCAALAGRVGERVRCTIYALRPQACRDFEPGSPECALARAEAGLAETSDP